MIQVNQNLAAGLCDGRKKEGMEGGKENVWPGLSPGVSRASQKMRAASDGRCLPPHVAGIVACLPHDITPHTSQSQGVTSPHFCFSKSQMAQVMHDNNEYM